MIPLVSQPKVTVWIENGCLKGLATNISPDLFFTLTSTAQDFEQFSDGMPFKNSELDWQPPDQDAT